MSRRAPLMLQIVTGELQAGDALPSVRGLAQQLSVNPNTVAYRIKRIGQLTGQDPSTSTGIVTLMLGLRLLDG